MVTHRQRILIKAAKRKDIPDDICDWDDLADMLFGFRGMSAKEIQEAFETKHLQPTTLLFDHSGPMMRYTKGALEIDDLNPEISVVWAVGRSALFKLGWNCFVAALLNK